MPVYKFLLSEVHKTCEWNGKKPVILCGQSRQDVCGVLAVGRCFKGIDSLNLREEEM